MILKSKHLRQANIMGCLEIRNVRAVAPGSRRRSSFEWIEWCFESIRISAVCTRRYLRHWIEHKLSQHSANQYCSLLQYKAVLHVPGDWVARTLSRLIGGLKPTVCISIEPRSGHELSFIWVLTHAPPISNKLHSSLGSCILVYP